MKYTWKFIEEYGCWDCIDESGKHVAFIQKRPAYCDRGHYLAITAGLELDSGDSRPNYYMELATAMNETDMFLAWRIHKERIPNPNHKPEQGKEYA